jgi:hypothetical protein
MYLDFPISRKRVIEIIKKDSAQRMKIARNEAEKLKAGNETTQKIREELIRSMEQTEEKYRRCGEMNKVIKGLMKENDKTEKKKRALEIAKNELEQEITEAKLERVNIMLEQLKKWQDSDGSDLKLQYDLKTGEIKGIFCMDKLIKKDSKCTCTPEEMRKAREKIQAALKEMKEAIHSMSGGRKTITNPDDPNKIYGKGRRLYTIIRYVLGLPDIEKTSYRNHQKGFSSKDENCEK